MEYEKRPNFMNWCSDEQWSNLRNSDLSAYNPNSDSYVPSGKDFKMSENEWVELKMEDQEVLMNGFYEKKRSEAELKYGKKKETNYLKVQRHWYNNIDAEDIIEAINKTRGYADEVIDFINDKESISALRNRNEALKFRVKFDDIKLRVADDKKLKRFPRYSHERKEIIFSNHSLLALWSHVFSLRK